MRASARAATPHSPFGIRLDGKPAIQDHSLFSTGAIEVQDEGSQLVSMLVAPRRHEMVVDFCAGAGGKTLLLGAMMRSQGRLYAFDVVESRLRRLRPRVARAGLSNVQPVLIAGERDERVKRLTGKIDRVLVDAPCTGTGTWRRNPDAKWRLRPNALTLRTNEQAAVLARAARLVKPGGRILYITCSVLPEENDEAIASFLADHKGFCAQAAADSFKGSAFDPMPWSTQAGGLQLSPMRSGTDGFYARLLVRKS